VEIIERQARNPYAAVSRAPRSRRRSFFRGERMRIIAGVFSARNIASPVWLVLSGFCARQQRHKQWLRVVGDSRSLLPVNHIVPPSSVLTARVRKRARSEPVLASVKTAVGSGLGAGKLGQPFLLLLFSGRRT